MADWLVWLITQNPCHDRITKQNFSKLFLIAESKFEVKISKAHGVRWIYEKNVINPHFLQFFENKIEGINVLLVWLFKMKVCIITMILKKEKLKKVINCAFGGVSKFKTLQFWNFFEIFFSRKYFSSEKYHR